MNVQQTSLEAYHLIYDKLGAKQRRIYDLLKKASRNGFDMTNREISRVLKCDTCRVTGRVFELRAQGLVILAQTRICTVTGYRAMAWKVK